MLSVTSTVRISNVKHKGREANHPVRGPEASHMTVRGAIVGSNFHIGSVRFNFDITQLIKPEIKAQIRLKPTAEAPVSSVRKS
jgi:hypothetical protein